jgi:hypothetical protein
MRWSTPTPTAEPLPYTRHDDQLGNLQSRATVPLSGEAIAQFDALLHEINPDAARADPDRLQHLVQWLLALPDEAAHDVLDRRLGRIEQLRAMLRDPDWDTDEPLRSRLIKLFGYIDRDDDLIDDHEPLIGLLDDVLLIELAWPVFAEEADEYLDFCAWRDDEHPVGSGDEQRTAWVRDRTAEIALWQHQLRVGDSHYAQSGRPDFFRVG